MKKVLPFVVSAFTAICTICGGAHSYVSCVDKSNNPKDGTVVNMVMPKNNLYVAPIKSVQPQKCFRPDTLSRAVKL